MDVWNREYPRPPAVDEAEGLFQAEIIGHRFTRGGDIRYRIHWVGYPSDEDQWVRRDDVADILVRDYEEKEKKRKERVTVNCIEALVGASVLTECLAITNGGEDAIHSGDDAPFKYEIRIPRPGKNVERPVLYISRNTKDFERYYESTERELACVVLVTDHPAIREVLRSSASTQYSIRLDKFRMLLAPFIDKLRVVYRPGKEMTNVDPLSRAQWSTNHTDADN
ncbi:hypothetical protein BGX38DRAFT_1207033 [Terfezia claveryi]|nr:hypothetical protein BGX38DRAFT_1207033 [Terfezia claveryi]